MSDQEHRGLATGGRHEQPSLRICDLHRMIPGLVTEVERAHQ